MQICLLIGYSKAFWLEIKKEIEYGIRPLISNFVVFTFS